MSQINRRPIKLREIGERFEALPADLSTIIEPMINREYLRLRNTSNLIAEVIIPIIVNKKFVNKKFINKEILVDGIYSILESTLGYNLYEFLGRYTYYYDNPKTSSYVPVYIPGSTFLTKGFINIDSIADYIAYIIIELIFKEFLLQNLKSIDSDSFTTSKKKIIIPIIKYLLSLFHDEGYIGIKMGDVIADYNHYL